MSTIDGQYLQRLPALELSIERYTAAVPNDGLYYLLRNGERLGRFKSLKAAREAWKDVITESNWEPPKRELDAKDYLVREATLQENERFHEYWGSSHKFRARGGVHRNR
jgi:hypothetical protein